MVKLTPQQHEGQDWIIGLHIDSLAIVLGIEIVLVA